MRKNFTPEQVLHTVRHVQGGTAVAEVCRKVRIFGEGKVGLATFRSSDIKSSIKVPAIQGSTTLTIAPLLSDYR